MKLALVAPGAVPAVQGGAENLWAGLLESFNRLPGVKADFISPPSPETSLMQVLQGYRRFGELDLQSYDRVVTTKYPAWACSHPNHVVYLQHTLRGLYDTYPARLGLWLSASQAQAMAQATQETKALAKAGPLLCRALEVASAPSWQLGARAQATDWAQSITPSTATLAGLLIQLLNALQDSHEHWAADYPGPFARACVRLLDAMALAPGRIRGYLAISETVAARTDYFPVGVTPKVLYHPTALQGDLSPLTHRADNAVDKVGTGDAGHASDAADANTFLLAPSRLEPPKRLDLLIRAYGQSGVSLPLWIVGTGPQEQELQALARETPGVVMKGFLSAEALAQAYARAAAVVFIPKDEDYGLIMVEAFQAGRPVLTCSDSGGPTELVVHEQSGYVAEPSLEGLAKGLQYLARSGHRLGAQGQRWTQANLNWASLAAELAGLPPQAKPNFKSNAKPNLTPTAKPHFKPRPMLLVLNTFPIEPVNSGGRQRMLGLYAGLAHRFDVQLLSLSTTDTQPMLRSHRPGLTELRLPAPQALRDRAQLYERQLGLSCFDITAAMHPELLHALEPLLRAYVGRAQLVVFSHPYMYPFYERFLEQSPGAVAQPATLVYEAHNVEARLKPSLLPDTALGRQLAHGVQALEARLARRASLVSACSAEDAEAFRALNPSVVVTPNGIAYAGGFQSWQQRLHRAQQRGFAVALFMGSAHAPNREAAQCIAQAANLLAHQASPLPWRLVLLGGCGLRPTAAMQQAPQLHCLGLVSDAEKQLWLEQATVGLNPMRSGSGTNLKIAEYAAAGLPVVATALGCRGWSWQPGKDYLQVEANALGVGQGLAAALAFMQQGQTSSTDNRLREQALQLAWPGIGRRFAQALEALL